MNRSKLLLAMLCLLLPGMALAQDKPAVYRIPDDTRWEIVSGRGEVKREGDLWVWDARPVDKGVTLGFKLPVDLADFDEIRLEYKPTEGPVTLMITTDGYPTDTLSRNWYDKNVLKHGQWNSFAVDLRLDDDGRPTQRAGSQDLWLNFQFHADPEKKYGNRRRVEFRNVRLVRHPVTWTIDYFRTRTETRDGRYIVSYPIAITNRMSREIEVTLNFEKEKPRTGDPLFELPTDTTWTLGPPVANTRTTEIERWGTGWAEMPGESLGLWISFSCDEKALAGRPPLWTEIVWPSLTIKGFDETVRPLHSSRYDPWFLVVPPPKVAHPVVDATPHTLRRARLRNEANPQFKGVLDRFVNQAERLLASQLTVPRQNTSGMRDPKTRRAVGYDLHAANGQRALNLARAWGLTGREAFRLGAMEVLERYADNYLLWQPTRESSTAFTSRTMGNTLMDGFRVWSYFMAWDYLRPAASHEQRRHIEDRFLTPMARSLDGHVLAYNNQMTQHQHGVFNYACATENWTLAMRYVEGPRGLFAMRQFGFDADGMGMEYDMGYHYNTIDPMIRMMIALGHLGWDDTGLDMYSTLRVPVDMASDPTNFRGGFPFRYEWAYARYRDPLFIGAIHRNKDGVRSFEALLYGAETVPEAKDIALTPAHLKVPGYVKLRHRMPSGAIRSVLVNYGSPHHRMHHDLLSVHISEGRTGLLDMMGQQGPTGRDGWYSTIADSLLAVDGKDQMIGRGRLVRMETSDAWQALEAATTDDQPLYEPVTDYHRLVLSAPQFVVLLDRAAAAAVADFHWALYPGQTIETPADWAKADHPNLQGGPDGKGPAHKSRTDWRAGKPVDRLTLTAPLRDEDQPMITRVLFSPAQTPYAFTTAGTGGGRDITNLRQALLLHGKQLRQAHWAVLMDRTAEASLKIEKLTVVDEAGKPVADGKAVAVRVTAPDGQWIVGMADRSIKASVKGVGPFDNGWLVVAPKSAAPEQDNR